MKTTKRLLAHLPAVLLLFFCLGISHWQMILSDFDFVPYPISTPAPTILAIMDHWYQWYTGKAEFYDLSFFYPIKNTLGYSDTFVLFGSIASLARFAGASPLGSLQFFYFFCGIFAFLFSYVIFIRHVKIRPFIAAALASLACFSLPLSGNGYFIQLYAINFLPFFVFLLCEGLIFIENKKYSFGLSALGGVYFGALLLNSFYIPWFFSIYAVIAFVTTCLFFREETLQWIRLHFQQLVWMLLIFAGGSSFFVYKFYKIYSGSLQEFGYFALSNIKMTLPIPGDLLNLGRFSWWYPDLFELAWPQSVHRKMGHEFHYGFSPLVLVLFVAVAFFAWRKKVRFFDDHSRRLISVFVVSTFVYWLLFMRFGAFSLWTSLIVHVIPGAKAIRAVFRANLPAILPIAFVIAVALNQQRQRLIANALALILVLELVPAPKKGYSKAEVHDYVAKVQFPEDCRAFLMVNRLKLERRKSTPERRAQLYSIFLGIPTVNGYSSHYPKDFPKAAIADEDEYNQKMHEWISANGILHETCTLDTQTAETSKAELFFARTLPAKDGGIKQ